jgi:hypothetical protein
MSPPQGTTMTQEPVEEVEPEILKPRKFGGRQPGSGRKKGSPNKITREIKEIAHQYGPGALKELARIAHTGRGEAARVAACRKILDRPTARQCSQSKGRWTTASASS